MQDKARKRKKPARRAPRRDAAFDTALTAETFRLFFDEAPDYCYVISPQGTILDVNTTALQALRYTKDELVGRPVLSLYSPDSADKAKGLFRKWRTTGVLVNEELTVLTKDGTARVVLLSVHALRKPDGGLLHSVSVQRDVTDLKHRQRTEREALEHAVTDSETKYRTLIEHLPAITYTAALNASGSRSYVSPQVESILGYSPAAYIDNPDIWRESLHPDDRPRVLQVLSHTHATGEPLAIEYRIRSRDDQFVWVRDEAGVVRDAEGRPLYLQGVMLDITAHRRANQELRRNYEVQQAINALLRLSLEEIPLDALLQRALGLVLALPWLAVEARGCVFLAEQATGGLTLIAHQGLPDSVLKQCASLPPGKCLCGRAASTGALLFATHEDENHELCCAGLGPHGHYCVPLRFGNRVYGVLTTYVASGMERTASEENFLSLAAHTLAAIVMRKRAKEEIRTYQSELRALAAKLVLAEESERKRLATALHDSLGQNLALIKIRLGVLGEQYGPGPASKALAEIRETFSAGIEQLRTLTFELSPPMLYELGLVPALEWLGERFEKQHGVRFTIQAPAEHPRPDDVVGVLLFQSVAELLRNVAKHAGAQHVTIGITGADARVRITVRDDGRGFDAAALRPYAYENQSFGIFSIRERMRHIGGGFEMAAQPGRGTTVTLDAPLRLAARTAGARDGGNDDGSDTARGRSPHDA